MKPFFISLSAVLILELIPAQAQVPPLLNFQGRVKVGSADFNGTGQFKFALVNNGGSQTFWSNNGLSTAGSEPTAGVLLNVVNGLYSVQLGDVGLPNMTPIPVSVFTNADVRLRVWFNDGVNGFQRLTPDQRIASVGYAMTAATVADGSISSRNLADGAVTASKVAPNTFLRLGGEASGAPMILGTTDNQPVEIQVNGIRALRLEPAAGPLEVAPNLIGGSRNNYVQPGVIGATIGGGGSERVDVPGGTGRMAAPAFVHQTILTNVIKGDFGTIAGGRGNWIASRESTIGGGAFNRSLDPTDSYIFIGGGMGNTVEGSSMSAIVGGMGNTIEDGQASAIGGGMGNLIVGPHGVIPGGDANRAGANAFAAGHRAKASHTGSFVWADFTEADFSSGVTNEFAVRATGGARFETGGRGLIVDGVRVSAGGASGQPSSLAVGGLVGLRLEPGLSPFGEVNIIGGSSFNFIGPAVIGSTISGGGSTNLARTNAITGDFAVIGGGFGNQIHAPSNGGVIAGGGRNTLSSALGVISGGEENRLGGFSHYSTISGGFQNLGLGPYAILPGGDRNRAGTNSFAAGHRAQATHTGAFVWADATDADFPSSGTSEFAVRASGGVRFETSGGGIKVDGVRVLTSPPDRLLVGGFPGLRLEPGDNGEGAPNLIGGSPSNAVAAGVTGATIAGGGATNISSGSSTVRPSNRIAADFGTISGGGGITIETGAEYATVAGGAVNRIQTNAFAGTISGGERNLLATNAAYSTIGGGLLNTNLGPYATVPGGDLNVAGTNSFAAGHRAKAIHRGAFVWGDSTEANVTSSTNNQFTVRAAGGIRFFSNAGLTAGAALAGGATSWSVLSDRKAKKDFKTVDAVEVLEKLAGVPVQQWHYRWEPETETPHIGPVAQDFKAAFYPGRDQEGITTLEFDGVELAAIQGLHQLVKKKEERIQSLEARLVELEKQMALMQDKFPPSDKSPK